MICLFFCTIYYTLYSVQFVLRKKNNICTFVLKTCVCCVLFVCSKVDNISIVLYEYRHDCYYYYSIREEVVFIILSLSSSRLSGGGRSVTNCQTLCAALSRSPGCACALTSYSCGEKNAKINTRWTVKNDYVSGIFCYILKTRFNGFRSLNPTASQKADVYHTFLLCVSNEFGAMKLIWFFAPPPV